MTTEQLLERSEKNAADWREIALAWRDSANAWEVLYKSASRQRDEALDGWEATTKLL